MSEYQYYEFRAVERPLARDQMDYLRALSSRATITPTSFQNTYNYGDFRGDPRELMKTCFDAHVYVSNFGTCVFMIRLPRAALTGDDLALYAAEDVLDSSTTDEHVIVEWRLDEEPGDEWVEGEAWMASLLPIRDEVARGDYRSLYIGWLRSVQAARWEDENEEDEREEAEDPIEDEEMDDGIAGDDTTEPPVPPGLRNLTAAQAALAEFLQLDSDLIEAAAAASPDPSSGAATPDGLDEWVAQLPNDVVTAAIARVIRGEALSVQTELQSRYYRSASAPAAGAPVGGRRRTAGELLVLARGTAREREQRETEERERQRRERLAALALRFPSLWEAANSAARKQTGSGYDEACSLLVDMRDAYEQAGRHHEFEEAFAGFEANHGGRNALRRRLEKAGLVGEGSSAIRWEGRPSLDRVE